MSAATTSMDLTRLELEAKATARKQVANLLQRPDQLEKVDQIRRRVSRKKVDYRKAFSNVSFSDIVTDVDF